MVGWRDYPAWGANNPARGGSVGSFFIKLAAWNLLELQLMNHSFLSKFLPIIAVFAAAGSSFGQDTVELSPFQVVGSKEAIFEIPGSSYYLSTEEIQTQNYTNITRVLGRIPGVYAREEDGGGNFPNISIRGGDGTRSSKVTIMEDGVLTAPAPYSAPSAYYSPNTW